MGLIGNKIKLTKGKEQFSLISNKILEATVQLRYSTQIKLIILKDGTEIKRLSDNELKISARIEDGNDILPYLNTGGKFKLVITDNMQKLPQSFEPDIEQEAAQLLKLSRIAFSETSRAHQHKGWWDQVELSDENKKLLDDITTLGVDKAKTLKNVDTTGASDMLAIQNSLTRLWKQLILN